MGYDCQSGKTKGKCNHCKVVWYWPTGKAKVKDTKCPECGASLLPTVHYLKRFPWKPLPNKEKQNV